MLDATAAIGILSRRGLGRVKHIDTVFLWVQERVDSMKITIHKKPTSEMLADLLTKFLGALDILKFITAMGFEYKVGSHGLKLEA